MELYFPPTEYDLETVLQVLFSIVCTLLVALVSIYLCAPEISQQYLEKWNRHETSGVGGTKKASVGSSKPVSAASDWDDIGTVPTKKGSQHKK